MNPENTRLWLWLRMTARVGDRTAMKLVSALGGIEAVFAASADTLGRVDGVSGETAAALAGRRFLKDADDQLARAERAGVRIVTPDDPAYPGSLREIPAPPTALFVRGALGPAGCPAVAIVGTRTPTTYGQRVAETFAAAVAQLGITVVSGMARGIDTAAHRGALGRKGRTVAVLGSGLDRIYPRENSRLADKIAASGALVSEFPLGVGPDRFHFPLRNRIISGLSRGVVVVEAGEKSGALITAGHALEQGKDVFAVPGSILSPVSEGCNHLIRDGAVPLTDAAQLVDHLFPSVRERVEREAAADPNRPSGPALDPLQCTVYESLRQHEARQLDQMSQSLNMEPAALSSILLDLELRCLVRELPGKRFVRV